MIRQSLLQYGSPLAATTAALPQPKGSEVLLKVSCCGVCHSDLHLQDGFFDLGDGKRLNVALGRKLPFTSRPRDFGPCRRAQVRRQASSTRRHVLCGLSLVGCGRCAALPTWARSICAIYRASRHQCRWRLCKPCARASSALSDRCSGHRYRDSPAATCARGLTAYSAIRKAERYLRRKGPLMIVGLGGVGLMGSRDRPRHSPGHS